MDRPATNVTDEVLANRNPRFELKPGQTIVLNMETISHAVRSWIRSGALELGDKVETEKAAETVAAKPKPKPKAKAPVKTPPKAKSTPIKAKTAPPKIAAKK